MSTIFDKAQMNGDFDDEPKINKDLYDKFIVGDRGKLMSISNFFHSLESRGAEFQGMSLEDFWATLNDYLIETDPKAK